MYDDVPKLLRNRSALEERLAQINAPHVARLNACVRELRDRLGSNAIVPWFDPWDGGENAKILWLLEAPGPKATGERDGSGIISCNNNDDTAANAWRTRVEANICRTDVVHWNAIPAYIGTETKIRAANPTDIAAAGPLLAHLLVLLPALRVVILGGNAAQSTWADHAPPNHGLRVIKSPHPSGTNVNTRPVARERIVAAWVEAGAMIRSARG